MLEGQVTVLKLRQTGGRLPSATHIWTFRFIKQFGLQYTNETYVKRSSVHHVCDCVKKLLETKPLCILLFQLSVASSRVRMCNR